jgi:hypothetical protein
MVLGFFLHIKRDETMMKSFGTARFFHDFPALKTQPSTAKSLSETQGSIKG